MCYLDDYLATAFESPISSRSSPSVPAMIPPDDSSTASSRSVRFQDDPVMMESSASEGLEQQSSISADTLWYHFDDLQVFRNEARDLCRQIREQQQHDVQPKDSATSSSHDNINNRGLELRSCVERQRRKYLANRYIIKASRKLNGDAAKLAKFAARCTTWAATLALEEGQRDYERAYNNDVDKEEDVQTIVSAAPVVLTTLKRQVSDEAMNSETASRSVRPRLSFLVFK